MEGLVVRENVYVCAGRVRVGRVWGGGQCVSGDMGVNDSLCVCVCVCYFVVWDAFYCPKQIKATKRTPGS